MNDIDKFQDGGFIPKEVFIEAREVRRFAKTSYEKIVYISKEGTEVSLNKSEESADDNT